MIAGRLVCTACSLTLFATAGCSSRPDPAAEVYSPRGSELADVDAMYRAYLRERNQPPARLADLAAYQDSHSNGFAAVQTGRCVVLWGAVPVAESADSAAALAYEKDAPQQGGLVLLRNGKLKRMSAAEADAAARAE
jgi:hypothetical protein